MPEVTESIAVTREVTIDAAPETVWEFLVDPAKVTLWMGESVEYDPRPGGIMRLGVVSGRTALGEFVEIEPPRRLVYTFGWVQEGDTPAELLPGASTVEFELTPIGDSTHVKFVHRDLPSSSSADAHSTGWDHYLQRLVTAGGGGNPGRDPWLDR